MIVRSLAGGLLAGAIAWAARRLGHLSGTGAVAALAVGTAAVAAGWAWGALLVSYFVSSSALTRLGRAAKAARTAETLPASHERTARQVLANGGVFAAGALAGTWLGAPRLHLAAAGALAAAAADTWATEVGTLWGGTPRSLRTGRPVAPGLSGGVTPVGLAASAIAAVLLACAVPFLQPAAPLEAMTAVALAGVAGSVADSLLGAVLQVRPRCVRCGTRTERAAHCDAPTRVEGGWRVMTNDTVNLLATVVGALVAGTVAPISR